MLVKSEPKRVEEHPMPGKDEPMVEFYLERQQFMDPGKKYVVPINVNGYEFLAEFGKRNRLPRSVVAILKNSKSMVSRQVGGMSTPNDVDRALGGSGRRQNEIMNGTPDHQYISDYNVVEEKEL